MLLRLMAEKCTLLESVVWCPSCWSSTTNVSEITFTLIAFKLKDSD